MTRCILLVVCVLFTGYLKAEPVTIAGYPFTIVDFKAAKVGSGDWPRAYDPKTGQYMPSKSIDDMNMKRGGGGLPMVYDSKNGRYLTPAIGAAKNAATVARGAEAIIAATGAGLVFVVAYEGALYWQGTPTIRDFTYCRIARTWGILWDTEIYDDDC